MLDDMQENVKLGCNF